ncbi:MAG: YHYH protein [Bacteroidota bacterium]
MNYRLFVLLALVGLSCSSEDDDAMDSSGDQVEVSSIFQQFTDNVTVYGELVNGEPFVVVETDDIPNHGSPYFGTSDSRYEAYNGTNPDFTLNPNTIVAQNIILKIPMEPRAAETPEATALGAIGVALNGVVFYNQYAGPNNRPLTNEINSFDQYLGHPQNQGQYHYHQEPTFLTETLGSDALLGWLLDGFPVYGPMENGSRVTNSDLDDFHGHDHATTDYPDGIYHYHITDVDPYINGSGFYGEAGTVSN